MLHFDDIVFGPIYSRRLGSSLGVNILPSKGKMCNFDCVYCECGWNRDGISDGRFPTYSQVKEALTDKISRLSSMGEPVDSITFSGNGEPTMNPDFPRIIDAALELRDRFYPEAKVSVLSNATLVWKEEVFEALSRVDNPIMKIDAGTDGLIARINRPSGFYRLDRVMESLKRFEGNFVLQTIFFRSDGYDTTEPDAFSRWVEIVRELRPREIMVYTIDRETPDRTLGKCSVEEMTALVRPLLDEGFKIQIRG